MKTKVSLISAATFILCTNSVTSISLDYEIFASTELEHSDNILLTRDQERSDTIRRAEVGIDLEEKTKHLEATVDYRAQYNDYKNDLLNDDTLIDGQANVRWSPLPQTFAWDFFSSTRNLQRDRREVDTLDNREKRTIISTGPVLSSRISKVDTLQLSGRFTTTTLEETAQSDNDRVSGRLDWKHKFSPTRELSAGFEHAATEFESSNQPDIENNNAYIGFSSELSSSRIQIRAGYNESKRDSQNSVSGPLLEAFVEYVSGAQQFSIIAINLITDSTIGLGANPTIVDENINTGDANFDNIDIVERLFSEIRYTNEALCHSCTVLTAIRYDDQDFSVQMRDETSLEMELGAEYAINSSIYTGIYLSRESIDFNDDAREDDIDSLRLYMNYSATNSLVIYLHFNLEERQSNRPEFEYDETRSNIGVRYRF